MLTNLQAELKRAALQTESAQQELNNESEEVES
jgi:hypothetical protein